MNRAVLFLMLAFCGSLPAQTISAPDAGFFRDGGGVARPVRGVAGAFVAGDASSAGNLSLAFSGVAGVRKTVDRLAFFDASGADIRTWAVPDGPALVAFDSTGIPTAVWLDADRVVLLWKTGVATRGAVSVVPRLEAAWQVRALAVTGNKAVLRLLADDGQNLLSVRVDSRTGNLLAVDPIGPASPAAWLSAAGSLAWVDAEHGELVLTESGGRERRFLLDATPTAIYQAGASWLALDEPGGRVRAVRLASDDTEVYSLPTTGVLQ